MRTGLFGPGATGPDDPDALLDRFWDRLAARFAVDPEADAFHDWTLRVVVSRRG